MRGGRRVRWGGEIERRYGSERGWGGVRGGTGVREGGGE